MPGKPKFNSMRAAVVHQPAPIASNPLLIEDVALPTPEIGQIRIKVEACGVCHTDYHIATGEIRAPAYPLIPGHQVVGFVDQLGERANKYKIGDRIGVPWLFETCGRCFYCTNGNENLCLNAQFSGFHVNGGFAELMVANEGFVFSIPTPLKSEEAAPLLCAGIIGYRSIRQADIKEGDTVGLIGFGASAHLTIQLLRKWNCKVIVFTRAERHRKHANELGAVWAGNLDQKPPLQCDRMILFAPRGEFIPSAMTHLRNGGTLAINAFTMSDIPGFPYATIAGEKTIRSVTNATRQDAKEFLEIAEKYQLTPTIKKYKIDDINQAFMDMESSSFDGEAVITF